MRVGYEATLTREQVLALVRKEMTDAERVLVARMPTPEVLVYHDGDMRPVWSQRAPDEPILIVRWTEEKP